MYPCRPTSPMPIRLKTPSATKPCSPKTRALWPPPRPHCTLTTGALDQLAAMGVQQVYVTLHVGEYAFQPVKTENLYEHQMHNEGTKYPAQPSRPLPSAARAVGALWRWARPPCAR